MGDCLHLTFDDGPDPVWTRRMLKELERLELAATFFVIGERVRQFPEVIAEVVAAGHSVQLHCDRHIRHSYLLEAELTADTERALESLAALEVYPHLWRAPWGVETEVSTRVAKRHGLKLVGWAIDTHDWQGDLPTEMLSHAREVLSGDGSAPGGGSVLMHDGLGPGAMRSDCENTVTLLGLLSGLARRRGMRLERLEDDAWEPSPKRAQAPSEHPVTSSQGPGSAAPTLSLQQHNPITPGLNPLVPLLNPAAPE